jgi:hypothetical protein
VETPWTDRRDLTSTMSTVLPRGYGGSRTKAWHANTPLRCARSIICASEIFTWGFVGCTAITSPTMSSLLVTVLRIWPNLCGVNSLDGLSCGEDTMTYSLRPVEWSTTTPGPELREPRPVRLTIIVDLPEFRPPTTNTNGFITTPEVASEVCSFG